MKNNCGKCGASFIPDYEGVLFGCEIPHCDPSIKYIEKGVLKGQKLYTPDSLCCISVTEEFGEFLLVECSVCGYRQKEPVVSFDDS